MSNNKTKTLELALARHIDPESTEKVNDQQAFNALGDKFVSKKSAVEGLKDYLKSFQSSPRVLGLLIYSEAGRKRLRAWVSQGMSTELLYRSMIFDGIFWQKANASFPLTEEVVNGDASWDFDPREFLVGVDLLTSVPGLIQAMVARMRKAGRIDDVLRYMPLRTVDDLLAQQPDVFAPEVEAVANGPRRPDEQDTPVTAVDLVRTYLDAQSAVEKVLGQNFR